MHVQGVPDLDLGAPFITFACFPSCRRYVRFSRQVCFGPRTHTPIYWQKPD